MEAQRLLADLDTCWRCGVSGDLRCDADHLGYQALASPVPHVDRILGNRGDRVIQADIARRTLQEEAH
jgi:hypothetical protein